MATFSKQTPGGAFTYDPDGAVERSTGSGSTGGVFTFETDTAAVTGGGGSGIDTYLTSVNESVSGNIVTLTFGFNNPTVQPNLTVDIAVGSGGTALTASEVLTLLNDNSTGSVDIDNALIPSIITRDTELNAQLVTITAAYTLLTDALGVRINDEITAREGGDNTVRAEFAAADTALGARIDAEAMTRATNDQGLDSRLATVESTYATTDSVTAADDLVREAFIDADLLKADIATTVVDTDVGLNASNEVVSINIAGDIRTIAASNTELGALTVPNNVQVPVLDTDIVSKGYADVRDTTIRTESITTANTYTDTREAFITNAFSVADDGVRTDFASADDLLRAAIELRQTANVIVPDAARRITLDLAPLEEGHLVLQSDTEAIYHVEVDPVGGTKTLTQSRTGLALFFSDPVNPEDGFVWYNATDDAIKYSASGVILTVATTADIQAETTTLTIDYENADNAVRNEFAAADVSIRTDFAAADQVILGEAEAYTDQQLANRAQARLLILYGQFVDFPTAPTGSFYNPDTDTYTGITLSDTAGNWHINAIEGDNYVIQTLESSPTEELVWQVVSLSIAGPQGPAGMNGAPGAAGDSTIAIYADGLDETINRQSFDPIIGDNVAFFHYTGNITPTLPVRSDIEFFKVVGDDGDNGNEGPFLVYLYQQVPTGDPVSTPVATFSGSDPTEATNFADLSDATSGAQWIVAFPGIADNMDTYASFATYVPAVDTLGGWSVPYLVSAIGPPGPTGPAGADANIIDAPEDGNMDDGVSADWLFDNFVGPDWVQGIGDRTNGDGSHTYTATFGISTATVEWTTGGTTPVTPGSAVFTVDATPHTIIEGESATIVVNLDVTGSGFSYTGFQDIVTTEGMPTAISGTPAQKTFSVMVPSTVVAGNILITGTLLYNNNTVAETHPFSINIRVLEDTQFVSHVFIGLESSGTSFGVDNVPISSYTDTHVVAQDGANFTLNAGSNTAAQHVFFAFPTSVVGDQTAGETRTQVHISNGAIRYTADSGDGWNSLNGTEFIPPAGYEVYVISGFNQNFVSLTLEV